LLVALFLLGISLSPGAQVLVSVNVAPPPLPVYAQPVVSAPGMIWAPGYWAWGPEGYYWVPGTWVRAPYVGALWTPGYWGWGGAAYVWHPGYWGPRVGYYGGINYGFGYFGTGYVGGAWNSGVFAYNTAVTNVNVTYVKNTYYRTVEKTSAMSRVSFNGGTGGVQAQPTAEDRLAEHDAHRQATPMQAKHEQLASAERSQLASENHGTPAVRATPHAGVYKQADAIGERGVRANEVRHAGGHHGEGAPPHAHGHQPD
jgi:hypothetical protein